MNARNPLAAGALALALTTPTPAAAESACIIVAGDGWVTSERL